MVHVKICGITAPCAADAAVEAGADALGFVFWSGSPRAVTPQQAAGLGMGTAAPVSRVGVFVSPSREEVARAARTAGLTVAQLHDPPPAEAMAGLDLDWYPALGVSGREEAADVLERAAAWGRSRFLLDARGASPGGTGRTFDWRLAAKVSLRAALGSFPRLILAGGLTPANVADAIRTVRPWGVDVSTGVESAPGVKDPLRIRAFVAAVRSVE
ncbi:MAG TPA: phosphoribosylanthranilate isomerase [Candidatus Polarisedimenticolia bacterium]|nr:phosphoribosylanthranilate isomerase [Candidatus Polarisedimenticolia bacterium]